MNWNDNREEKRWILYLLGFNDGEIGVLSEPVVGKSNVCSWRGKRGLSPNNGLCDRKWYPANNLLNNPLHKALDNRPGIPLSEEREEFLLGLHNKGLNDVEIAERAKRGKSSIRRWRLRKGLRANAIRGGQPNQSERKPREKKIVNEPKKKKIGRPRNTGVKQRRQEIARQKEEEIIQSLPSKEEVYRKVRNSPDGQITTAQLIKDGYGDVGHERRDTVHKLRVLADQDHLLELDTDEKGQIIWRV